MPADTATLRELLLTSLMSDEHCFADTLAFIDQHYQYRPSAFRNGPVDNSAEQNQGSCKILSMAQDLGLSQEQTLQCFAEHYRSVLAEPDGVGHANIRALIEHDLSNVRFTHPPLIRR